MCDRTKSIALHRSINLIIKSPIEIMVTVTLRQHYHHGSAYTVIALVLFVIAIPVIASNHNEDATNDKILSWTIFHSWGSDFVRRGSLVWNPEKLEGDDGKRKDTSFEIINDDKSANLTAKDIKDMLDYGWYSVKIQGGDSVTDQFVFQTVPACNLQRANFKDQFDITFPRSSLDSSQDSITSFAYTPLVSPLAPKSCDYESIDDEKVKVFSSKVNVQLDKKAMTMKNVLSQSKPPPGIMFIKQPRQPGVGERGDQEGGEKYDDPDAPNPIPSPFSFLQKYWYIILPMVLLQFIQKPAEEGPPQQGSEPQGGNENQSSNNDSSTPTQTVRRGKRSNKKKN